MVDNDVSRNSHGAQNGNWWIFVTFDILVLGIWINNSDFNKTVYILNLDFNYFKI